MPSYKDEKTGKWYCSFRYTDIHGKRVQKLKRGFALKREADKWERDFLSTEHADKITVGVLINAYLKEQEQNYHSGDIKYSSLIAVQNCVRLYLKPYWENVIADKVMPMHVNEWIAKITVIDKSKVGKQAKSTKTRRSSKTLNRAKGILKAVFHLGHLNFGLQKNPVDDAKKIKGFSNDSRTKVWSFEQYNIFRDSISREDMKVLFDIQYYAGLRIGEALALTPADISQYKLSITKAVFYPKYNEMLIDRPKSDTSIRDVEIPKFLYEEICEHIKKLDNMKADTLIFTMTTAVARQYLYRHTDMCDLPHISPHILRHSYASYMLTLTDVATVSKQLGHSNPSITLKIYSHAVEENNRNGVDALEKLLEKQK